MKLRLVWCLFFFVFSAAVTLAQDRDDDQLHSDSECHIAEIFKKDLVNDKVFVEFLKPYFACLLPDTTIDYDKEGDSSFIVSMPDDSYMTIYISDLRLTLLQMKREERSKKAESFFHRAFFSILGEEKNVNLNDVMPVIRSTAKVQKIKHLFSVPEKKDTLKSKDESTIPYNEIASGITQAYIIDQNEIVSYVSNYDLQEWNISASGLQQKALNNLRRFIAENPVKFRQHNSLNYVEVDNYYDSSLAVLPEVWNDLAKQGNGSRLLVAFLTYDNVLYTFENDQKGIDVLRAMIKGMVEQNDIISRKIYVWDNGKWSIFK